MIDHFLNGTKISLTNPENVLFVIKNYSFEHPQYISLFGLDPLMQSFRNQELQSALNESLLNPLHGKSLEFYFKLKGEKNIKTVDGIFLLENLLKKPFTHYFYGTNDETLQKIENKIKKGFPDAKVLGYKEPPFFDIQDLKNNTELENDFLMMNEHQPDLIWVGLGGGKQDLVMHHYSKYLDKSLMLGVGAVFDYFASNINLSSEVVKSSGLRWLHRLVRQPKLIQRKLTMIKILLSLPFNNHRKTDNH